MALLKIAAFDIYRFSIPFVRPMKVGHVLLDHREGFLISLTDENGCKARGEVAPLPGLDSISLDQCRNDLSLLQNKLADGVFNTDRFDLNVPGLAVMPLPASLSPHTLFGLESAFLGLYLQNTLNDLPDFITVPVNGLLIPDIEDAQTDVQIQSLQRSGIKTVKVKIGRLPADQEIRQILRLHTALGPDMRLRLDGNRTLSASAYAYYFSALKHLNIEYAEEPLLEGEASSQDISWPIALDESLTNDLIESRLDPVNLPGHIRTVILKPGLLPGLSGMASFIASAHKQNIQTVLSSSFNTGIGLAALGLFARLIGLSSDTACGFDTLRYLQSDVITDSPSISEGKLKIPKRLFADMQLNFHVLTKEDL